MIKIGSSEEQIIKSLNSSIGEILDSAGIYNRVFSRIKSVSSIEKKIKSKKEEYLKKGKKLQDIFGIRVTLYFSDDEGIAIDLLKSIYEELPESHSIDPIINDKFGPIRKNLVFKLKKELVNSSNLFQNEFIDETFEVQFRTIFSEGWHEVEHDLRYKCKEDWSNENQLSRQLNGLLAVLETSDWAIHQIFDGLAYKKYKERAWNSFFRNVVRIRFSDYSFSPQVLDLFDKDTSIPKNLLKQDRTRLITQLTKLKTKVPLKLDNVLFIINRTTLNNSELYSFESNILRNILDESFPNG
ncbi:MAG: GTP pyrophosphokinase [Bacteroidaceae bacterium]|nr:GTP pyrophosphokinase [Bacteroidaceae bacterium]